MIEALRRLHPRGPISRGIAVDAEGAMFGPDCALVRRTPQGFRCVSRSEARAIQAAVLGIEGDPDWLFEQCRHIAASLARGETALAQIYGLRVPIGELDDGTLRQLAALGRLLKANFNPDEPRIPKGEPGAGQWTDGGDGGADEGGVGDDAGGDAGSGGDSGAGSEGSPSTGGGAGGNDAPPGAGGDNRPPIEYSIDIPAERPDTAQERNSIVRRSAEWLRQAAALGAVFAPEPRVRLFFAGLEATAWVVEYLPEIRSYLDAPRSLEELQNAVDDPEPGYQLHHIVEEQSRSIRDDSNARIFGGRLQQRDNLVRIPKWKHVEISTWYSTPNREEYGGQTPRDLLRGKSWNEQYELGIQKLQDFGVLK